MMEQPKYVRTSSGTSPEKIAKLKAKFKIIQDRYKDNYKPLNPPPVYDEIYFAGLRCLERL